MSSPEGDPLKAETPRVSETPPETPPTPSVLRPARIMSNEEIGKLPRVYKKPLLPSLPGRSEKSIVEYEDERIQSWLPILSSYIVYSKKNPNSLKRLIRKGVPDTIRGRAWLNFSNAEEQARQCKDEVEGLLRIHESEPPTTHTKEGGSIDSNVSRTFPTLPMFQSEQGWGTQRLKRLLISYCVKHPDIGYCQGMNFIGGIILQYLLEDQAFWLFNTVIHDKKYDLQSLYGEGLYKLHMYSFIFDCLLKKFMPKLSAHFNQLGLNSLIYLPEWLLPLFARTFPLEFVVRVWDAFLYEGNKILFRISLALIKTHQNEFLTGDLSECMSILQQIPDGVNVDLILDTAYDFSLSHTHVEKFQAEYMVLHPPEGMHSVAPTICVTDLSSPNIAPSDEFAASMPSPPSISSESTFPAAVSASPMGDVVEYAAMCTFEEIEEMRKPSHEVLIPMSLGSTTAEREAAEEQRVVKWRDILARYSFYAASPISLKVTIRKGVPDSLRGNAWLMFNQAAENGRKLYGSLDQVLKLRESIPPSGHTKVGGTIDRDIPRTFSELKMFCPEGYGSARLKRLLIGYCLVHPEVGYCQGMNFVAGILLQYFPENQAFWLFCSVIHDKKYDLQCMYGEGLYKLHMCVYQFDRLLNKFMPKLKQHMDEENIFPAIYVPEFVVRVWDAFLYEGIKILFRISLAILSIYSEQLLATDMEGIMRLLREIPTIVLFPQESSSQSQVDVESVLSVAYSFSLSHRHLEKFQAEYEQQNGRPVSHAVSSSSGRSTPGTGTGTGTGTDAPTPEGDSDSSEDIPPAIVEAEVPL